MVVRYGSLERLADERDVEVALPLLEAWNRRVGVLAGEKMAEYHWLSDVRCCAAVENAAALSKWRSPTHRIVVIEECVSNILSQRRHQRRARGFWNVYENNSVHCAPQSANAKSGDNPI